MSGDSKTTLNRHYEANSLSEPIVTHFSFMSFIYFSSRSVVVLIPVLTTGLTFMCHKSGIEGALLGVHGFILLLLV